MQTAKLEEGVNTRKTTFFGGIQIYARLLEEIELNSIVCQLCSEREKDTWNNYDRY